MRVAGAADRVQDLQKHIGWPSSAMPQRYSRAGKATDMEICRRLQQAIDGDSEISAREVETQFQGSSYDTLPSTI